MKRTLPVFLAMLSGLSLVAFFFLNRQWTPIGGVKIEDLEVRLLQWVTIIGGFTLLLGVVSIFRVNMRAIRRDNPDRLYKAWTIIAILVAGLPGLFPSPGSDIGKSLYAHLPAWCASYLGTQPGTIYDWLFNTLNAPMMATMFATLAFYIASAAYRAFRARNAEATLLLIAAIIIMFWRVPMGEIALQSIHPELPDAVNKFLMAGINGAVQRGIIIGAALGAASMSLRILLGIERTYMGKS